MLWGPIVNVLDRDLPLLSRRALLQIGGLLQCLDKDRAQCFYGLKPLLGIRLRTLADEQRERCPARQLCIGCSERAFHEVVNNTTERVDVRTGFDLVHPSGLLRGHVPHSAP